MTNPTNTKLHVEVEGQGLVHVHPETNFSQVIDMESGRTLQETLENYSGGIVRTHFTPFSLIATSDNQTIFEFQDSQFNVENNILVHVNGEFMHPNEEYTVSQGMTYPYITLAKGIGIGNKVHILVEHSTVTGTPPEGGGSGGGYRTQTVKHTLTATTKDQVDFDFQDPYFNIANDGTIVFLQSEPLIEGEEYTISQTGSVLTLATGVPVGTKIHIIVLRNVATGDGGGSGSGGGLTDNQLALINSIIPEGDYFIDGVNGNDANDGRTKETAWKTLNKVNTAFSNKQSSRIILNIAGGTYNGNLFVKHFTGELRLQPYSEQEVTFNIISSGFAFNNISSLEIEGKIKFVGDSLYNDSLIAIIKVGTAFIHEDVTFEGGDGAIYVEYSHVYVKGSFIDQKTHLLKLSTLADVVAGGHLYKAKNNLVSVLCSAKYRSYLPREGSQPETVNDFANSSTDLNQVANGIIIEEGSNANGKFTKYANGIIEMTHKIITTPTSLGDMLSVWTYPHALVSNTDTVGFVTVNGTKYSSHVDSIMHLSSNVLANIFTGIQNTVIAGAEVNLSLLVKGRWK